MARVLLGGRAPVPVGGVVTLRRQLRPLAVRQVPYPARHCMCDHEMPP